MLPYTHNLKIMYALLSVLFYALINAIFSVYVSFGGLSGGIKLFMAITVQTYIHTTYIHTYTHEIPKMDKSDVWCAR